MAYTFANALCSAPDPANCEVLKLLWKHSSQGYRGKKGCGQRLLKLTEMPKEILIKPWPQSRPAWQIQAPSSWSADLNNPLKAENCLLGRSYLRSMLFFFSSSWNAWNRSQFFQIQFLFHVPGQLYYHVIHSSKIKVLSKWSKGYPFCYWLEECDPKNLVPDMKHFGK